MEIEFINKEKNFVEIKVIDADIGLLNAVKEILLNEKDIEFAAVKRGHFLKNEHFMSVRTSKKDPMELIKKAIDTFQKDLKKMEDLLKK